MTYRLELKNISMSFGEVQSLRNVNFHVDQNEIVGLLGDNGAGKSTLIKIVTGYHRPTSGELYFNGQKIDHLTVPKARELGVETVYQERALADQVALRIHIRSDVMGDLAGRMTQTHPFVQGRRPEPHGTSVFLLIPQPEPDVMPLTRAVADRLLKGQILFSTEEVQRTDWRFGIRLPKHGINRDANTAVERNGIGRNPPGARHS